MQSSGCRVQGSGCRNQGAGFRVQGSGCMVQASGCRVQVSGFRFEQQNAYHQIGTGEEVLQTRPHSCSNFIANYQLCCNICWSSNFFGDLCGNFDVVSSDLRWDGSRTRRS